MIYELRRYEVAPNKMSDLHNRFRNHTIRLFKKHGITPVLFLQPVIGEASNIFTYIVRFESLAEREKAWDAFMKDKERIDIWQKSNENGQIVLKIENKILSSTEYSPKIFFA